MAGLRWWDGSQWQTLLGGPPTYAYIGTNAPLNPPNGMIWVQPIDPIVDLFAPETITEPDAWQWAGFGYQFPGLSFVPEAQGMRLNWNPAPAQPGNGHQLGSAPFTGEAFDGHQLLAQATVVVGLGSPDVRLSQAFTASTAWITEKDVEVTVTLPILWQTGMVKNIGIESQTNPGPGTSVLVKDIHLFDLTSSPPSPMRVWSETLNLWLPINDGLVQRAGDRMVGSLRFDTIDSAFGQPTVTGLPTPFDLSDAVPYGFLIDALNSLPQPPTDPTSGLVVISDTEPVDPAVGLPWWDTSKPDVWPHTVVVSGPGGAAVPAVGNGVWAAVASWPKWQMEIPCNGLLKITSSMLVKPPASATAASKVLYTGSDGCTVTDISRDVQSLDIGRVSVGSTVSVSDTSSVAHTLYSITDIPPGGSASIILAWFIYSSIATGSSFRLPSAICEFIPYGDERVVFIDMEAL